MLYCDFGSKCHRYAVASRWLFSMLETACASTDRYNASNLAAECPLGQATGAGQVKRMPLKDRLTQHADNTSCEKRYTQDNTVFLGPEVSKYTRLCCTVHTILQNVLLYCSSILPDHNVYPQQQQQQSAVSSSSNFQLDAAQQTRNISRKTDSSSTSQCCSCTVHRLVVRLAALHRWPA